MNTLNSIWAFAKHDIHSILNKIAAKITSTIIQHIDDYFENQKRRAQENATAAAEKANGCKTQEAQDALREQSQKWTDEAAMTTEHQAQVRKQIANIVNEMLSAKNVLPKK